MTATAIALVTIADSEPGKESASSTLDLDSYQARKESARCTLTGCRRAASDRSSLCLKHYRAHKRTDRAWRAKRRDARRAAGECVDCPGDRPARATAGSSRCLACRIRRKGLKAADRATRVARLGSDDGVVQGVDQRAAAIAAATRRHADGRTRYHGQQKRGQQPKAQLNRQDLRHVREDFEAFAAGIEILAERGGEMHRGERERVEGATASRGVSASGRMDDILERLGAWKPERADRVPHVEQRHGARPGEKQQRPSRGDEGK